MFDSLEIKDYDFNHVLTELDLASKNTKYDTLVEFDFLEYDINIMINAIDVFIEGHNKEHPGPTSSVVMLLRQIHGIILNVLPDKSSYFLKKKWVFTSNPPKSFPPFIE